MESGLKEAYRQIRTQRYAEGILSDGCAGVISFGICFCKKSCIVGLMPEPDAVPGFEEGKIAGSVFEQSET